MIDFFQWLKDSYLDEPEEQEIPVEVEVVEVEQKQPDEPIVIKIEAPFEPTPTQPLSCLLYTSPSPRDATLSRMPSSA